MISFIVSMILLVLGYIFYGRFVEKVFGPDNRQTPAVAHPDGVDYIVLPGWKIFMIQFLNIAGTGPIFGAIMGMQFGPSAYLWIVFGCIFAGAVHDYLSGMMSLRHNGAGLPKLIGVYLGSKARVAMLIFSFFLLVMVGAVFVYSPAIIMGRIFGSTLIWIAVIFVYYIIATLMPIDKIIGRIYPLFAFSLLFMAVALMVCLFVKWPTLPEVWNGLDNLGAEKWNMKDQIFPALFITIACGAISGFHATQSPLMARCLKNEKQGRPVFYGAMITEGLVALIWATVSSYFFFADGWREVVDTETLKEFYVQRWQHIPGVTLIEFFNAPEVVSVVCSGWLGVFGGILAMFGVVAAPITSGDTALRSARLIVAEAFNVEQKSMSKRLMISIPIFALSFALLVWQMSYPDGFNTIWRYFGWSNQALSVFTLWTITVYLEVKKKPYIITLIPAMFMTMVCTTFLLHSRAMLNMDRGISCVLAALFTLFLLTSFLVWKTHRSKTKKQWKRNHHLSKK